MALALGSALFAVWVLARTRGRWPLVLAAVTLSGEQRWTLDVPGAGAAVATAGGHRCGVVVGAAPEELCANESQVNPGVRTVLTSCGGTAERSTVTAYDLQTGALAWQRTAGSALTVGVAVSSAVAVDDQLLALISGADTCEVTRSAAVGAPGPGSPQHRFVGLG